MRIVIEGSLFTLFTLLTVSSPVFASGDCMDNAVTQTDMNICADKEYNEADAKLNSVYNKLRTKYVDEPLFLDKLKTAQQAWIKFRDAEVAAHFPVATKDDPYFEYGSMYPMLTASLMTTLTRERTKQLIELLELGFGN